jgi:DNA-directed RNA polymerase subunit RPC12/RpoP
MDDSAPTHDKGDPGGRGDDDFLTKAKLLLQRKLLVICGSCGERLTVEQRLAGRTLRCPACGGQILIPHQADEDDFPDISTHMDVLDITEELEPSPTESDAYLSAESDEDRGRSRWPVAIILIVMTGLAGIVIGYILRGQGGRGVPEEKPPTSIAPARPEPAPTTRPTVTIPPVVATTRSVTPLPKPKAIMRIRQVKTAILADGLVPAPLGRMFLYVKVDVIASRDALSINVTGGDVVLESESGKIAPLGMSATGSIVPMVARGGMIVVKPSAGR